MDPVAAAVYAKVGDAGSSSGGGCEGEGQEEREGERVDKVVEEVH